MSPDLQNRLVRVSRAIDRLTQIRHITDQNDGTDVRGHVASAAVAAAEYIATITGHEEETGTIHRAYEEILAAIENSPAISEMVRGDRVSAQRSASVRDIANRSLREFRIKIAAKEEGA